jgi:hypothetical protein
VAQIWQTHDGHTIDGWLYRCVALQSKSRKLTKKKKKEKKKERTKGTLEIKKTNETCSENAREAEVIEMRQKRTNKEERA